MGKIWRWINFSLRLVIALVLAAIPLGIFAIGCFFFSPEVGVLVVYRWKNGLVSWVKEPLHDSPQLSVPGLR